MTFSEKVHAVVKQIPRGSVLTYKEVAYNGGEKRKQERLREEGAID